MAIRFAIEADLRFISHHDTMRMFERALSRAQLPVRYTEGFNPHPRFSLPMPRPLGVASRAEWLVVEFDEPIDPSRVLIDLKRQMPAGLTLLEAGSLRTKKAPVPQQVRYALDVPDALCTPLGEKLQTLLEQESYPIQRVKIGSRHAKTFDLRSYLIEAALSEGHLTWTFKVTGEGTARPGEFLQAIGLDARQWLHCIQRTDVQWSDDPFETDIAAAEVSPED